MRIADRSTRSLMIGSLVLLGLAAPVGKAGAQEEPRRERGDFEVRAGEVVDSDLIVERGSLVVAGEVRGSAVVGQGDAFIRGRVRGSVIAIYGDVFVEEGGLVDGDAVSVSGEVVLRGSGRVLGSNISTTARGLRRQPRDVEWARVARASGLVGPTEEPGSEQERSRGSLGERSYNARTRYRYAESAEFPLGAVLYNRVDGFTLQGEVIDSEHDWGGAGTLFYGGAGYAFTSKRFYYRLGISRYWLRSTPLEAGVGLYRQLETRDDWTVTPNENDWMALLTRHDWYDYHLREGVGAHLRFSPAPWLSLGARFSSDLEEPVIRRTNWSLFGGDRVFRENEFLTMWDPDPSLRTYEPAADGEVRRLIYHLRIRTSGSQRGRGSRGLFAEVTYEQAGDSPVAKGGDFTYERADVQVLAYQRLSPVDHLALRLRAGAARGADGLYDAIPVQHRFYLGGIGSLRGYDLKQFTGDRMFLATLEYTIGGGWSRALDDWALTFFYDYGLAWRAAPGTRLSDGLTPDQGVRAVGAAVTPGWFDDLRLEIARPLDGPGDEFRYYIRFSFSF